MDDAYGVNFEPKATLCPKLWVGFAMKPVVRAKLLKIANAFVDSLGIEANPVDIRLTGSLANYNYTSVSDIDLHVVFDFDKEGWNSTPELSEVVKELFIAKKTVWNTSHNLAIGDHPVELYAQDSEEPHTASGQYSVSRGAWITKPDRENVVIDYAGIRAKAKDLIHLIDKAVDEDDLESIEQAKRKIKSMRKEALESGGEFSTGNLAFKLLRRLGYLEKLYDAAASIVDKAYTMEGAHPFADQTYSDRSGNYSIVSILDYCNRKKRPVSLSVSQLVDNNQQIRSVDVGDEPFSSRADRADLDYPIVAVYYPGSIRIADGEHRLHKAYSLGLDSIKGYLISGKELSDNVEHLP